jgi:hypothetical protein
MDLESLSPGQLFGLFDTYLKTKSIPVQYTDLAIAWGLLFSNSYLSADELINSMQKGQHLLGEDKERVLREFIHADCRSGGVVVLDVIRKGGNIDRAALIMIANHEDLAGLQQGNTTALHMLAEACDRTVRPILILRAGKKALGGMFDASGLPVLFKILSLNDLRKDDLKAIGQVFTRDELAHVKNKNRTGRSILEIYTEAGQRLKGRVPGERNTFFVSRAVKNTRLKAERPERRGGQERPGTDIFGESGGEESSDEQSGYRDLISSSSDRVGRLFRRGPGHR